MTHTVPRIRDVMGGCLRLAAARLDGAVDAWRRSEAGNIAVEFGFVAPVAAVILIGTIDLGLTANDVMKLRTAARAGAQYALSQPTDTDGIAQTVLNSTSLPSDKLTVASDVTCECSNGSAVACDVPCDDGKQHRRFVSVEVTQTFVPLIPFTGFGLSIPVSGSATFRMQ
jgi:Flp pilus assembly protein TadG